MPYLHEIRPNYTHHPVKTALQNMFFNMKISNKLAETPLRKQS